MILYYNGYSKVVVKSYRVMRKENLSPMVHGIFDKENREETMCQVLVDTVGGESWINVWKSDLIKYPKIGYKIMTFLDLDSLLHSMADSRLTMPLKKGHIIRNKEFWLGTTKEYVLDYYGSSIEDPAEMVQGNYEALCEFHYRGIDIVKGTQSTQGCIDKGTEFAVRKAVLVSVYNVTKKEIIL